MTDMTQGVIDAQTGTICSTEHLRLVQAPEAEWEKIDGSDSEAIELANSRYGKPLRFGGRQLADLAIAAWSSRCRAQGYSKSWRLKRQAEFFTGFMAALNAVGLPDGDSIPPKLFFGVVRGEDLFSD